MTLAVLNCATTMELKDEMFGTAQFLVLKKSKSSKSQTKQLFHTNSDRLSPLEICKPKQTNKKKKKRNGHTR
jgi:hypothetical protein